MLLLFLRFADVLNSFVGCVIVTESSGSVLGLVLLTINCVIDGVVVVVVCSCFRLLEKLLVSVGGHRDVVCVVGWVKMSLHDFVVVDTLMGGS